MLENLLEWWNLVFLLPFVGASVFMLVQGVSGLDSGDAHVDHDVDAGGGHDLAHDLDHDADYDHDAEPSGFTKALLFLGVGRVPVATLISALGVLWGVSGWIANQALEPVLGSPGAFFPVSCAVAFVAATLGTRWTARIMARLLPATETSVTRKSDLVDCVGRVRYQITERQGSVMVNGPQGHLQEVSCRVKEGKAPIPSGTSVILFEYDEARDLFYAAESNLEGTGGHRHNLTDTSLHVRNPKEKAR
ncbi:MAG TPA: hypothetical protein VKK31_22035 [Thermoanaerobaculia bacterium]|nr:hypothetical protein [Thermoanaerobaculia bacterium]